MRESLECRWTKAGFRSRVSSDQRLQRESNLPFLHMQLSREEVSTFCSDSAHVQFENPIQGATDSACGSRHMVTRFSSPSRLATSHQSVARCVLHRRSHQRCTLLWPVKVFGQAGPAFEPPRYSQQSTARACALRPRRGILALFGTDMMGTKRAPFKLA